jgi:hypothetical protein
MTGHQETIDIMNNARRIKLTDSTEDYFKYCETFGFVNYPDYEWALKYLSYE